MVAAAIEALHRGQPEVALVGLLARWRETRASALADAIDHVSNIVTAAAEPIAAPSVRARTLAWEAIAKHRDPRDVGRLVATPLPRTIKALDVAVRTLIAWDDDPRIAQALVRFVEEHVLSTAAGQALERYALLRVRDLRDRRAIPRLRAIAAAGTWQRVWSNGIVDNPLLDVIAALEAIAPEPDVESETALAALSRGIDDRERRLIEAIQESPDDRELVEVYGDWLVERGDPRGELVALQLAREVGRATEATRHRERELVAAHGRRWAGTLDRWFVEDDRHFARGSFAGGRLTLLAQADREELLASPAAALVRVLAVDARTEVAIPELVAAPELRGIAIVGVLQAATASRVASGASCPHLRELHVRLHEGLADEHLARCAALPGLVAIGVWDDPAGLETWCATAPVIERVERIALVSERAAVFEALAARGGSLRELELVDRVERIHDAPGWHVRVARDGATGPFTRLVAERRPGGDDTLRALADKLDRVPAAWPRSVRVVASQLRLAVRGEDTRIEAALARFTNATEIDVPWSRPRAAAIGRILHVELATGFGLDGDRFPILWDALAAFGQSFDGFSLKYSDTIRPLGDEPVKRLVGWMAKNTYRIVLRAGSTARATLERNAVDLQIALGDHTYDDLVTWLGLACESTDAAGARIVELAGFHVGSFGHDVRGGWVTVLPPTISARLTADDIAALARARPELAGLSVRELPSRLAVQLAPTPDEVAPTAGEVLGRELRRLLVQAFIARHGFELAGEVRGAFAGVAAALGFVENWERELEVSYQLEPPPGAAGTFYLTAKLSTSEPPVLESEIYCSGQWHLEGVRTRHVLCAPVAIGSRGELVERLDAAARTLAELAGWIATIHATRR